jgi:hypothetical protein
MNTDNLCPPIISTRSFLLFSLFKAKFMSFVMWRTAPMCNLTLTITANHVLIGYISFRRSAFIPCWSIEMGTHKWIANFDPFVSTYWWVLWANGWLSARMLPLPIQYVATISLASVCIQLTILDHMVTSPCCMCASAAIDRGKRCPVVVTCPRIVTIRR